MVRSGQESARLGDADDRPLNVLLVADDAGDKDAVIHRFLAMDGIFDGRVGEVDIRPDVPNEGTPLSCGFNEPVTPPRQSSIDPRILQFNRGPRSAEDARRPMHSVMVSCSGGKLGHFSAVILLLTRAQLDSVLQELAVVAAGFTHCVATYADHALGDLRRWEAPGRSSKTVAMPKQ